MGNLTLEFQLCTLQQILILLCPLLRSVTPDLGTSLFLQSPGTSSHLTPLSNHRRQHSVHIRDATISTLNTGPARGSQWHPDVTDTDTLTCTCARTHIHAPTSGWAETKYTRHTIPVVYIAVNTPAETSGMRPLAACLQMEMGFQEFPIKGFRPSAEAPKRGESQLLSLKIYGQQCKYTLSCIELRVEIEPLWTAFVPTASSLPL